MSKISVLSFNVAAATIVAVTLLFAGNVICGQDQNPPENPKPLNPQMAMYGMFDITHPNGNVVTYTGYVSALWSDHCYYPGLGNWPNSHITSAGNEIWHVTNLKYQATLYAMPPFGVLHLIDVAEAANRLWDSVYSVWGYTKVDITAGIDTSMNCHGYSTGYNSWMHLQPALKDDYESTSRRDYLVPGSIFVTEDNIPILNVFEVGSHSSRIEAVHLIAGTHDLQVKVVEKNRVSALYTKSFTMKALCPNNDHLHTGHCNMDMGSVDLPWSPSLYRKK